MASLVVDTTQTPTVITGSTTGSFTKVTPRKHHGSSSSTTTAATTSTTHVEAATATATATAATAPTAAMSTATAGAPTLHASSSTAARGNARTASPTSTAATGAGAGAGSGAGSRSGSASGPRLTTDGRVTQFHGVTEEGARVSKPTPSLLPPQHAVIDPFFNHQPWSCKLVAKAILTTLILVPIRCAIIVVTIFFGYMFVFASSCCIPKDYNKVCQLGQLGQLVSPQNKRTASTPAVYLSPPLCPHQTQRFLPSPLHSPLAVVGAASSAQCQLPAGSSCGALALYGYNTGAVLVAPIQTSSLALSCQTMSLSWMSFSICSVWGGGVCHCWWCYSLMHTHTLLLLASDTHTCPVPCQSARCSSFQSLGVAPRPCKLCTLIDAAPHRGRMGWSVSRLYVIPHNRHQGAPLSCFEC